MKLLAIETSAEIASVALLTGDDLTFREGGTPGTHARFLLGWVGELLAEAGISAQALDGIAFSAGPGSFTGLRLAVSVAQGLALAGECPLASVPTLDALALAQGDGFRLCCVDARMSETYSVACEVRGLTVTALSDIRVGAPGELLPPPGDLAVWSGCGSGFALPAVASLAWIDQLDAVSAAASAHAREVALLGRQALASGAGIDPAMAAPLYVRDKVAQTTAERLAAGGRA